MPNVIGENLRFALATVTKHSDTLSVSCLLLLCTKHCRRTGEKTQWAAEHSSHAWLLLVRVQPGLGSMDSKCTHSTNCHSGLAVTRFSAR